MTEEVIRPARLHEREALEDLQLQASLMWLEDRASLLANPDAIDLPTDQIADGNVYVCEADGEIVGFGVVLPRADGQAGGQAALLAQPKRIFSGLRQAGLLPSPSLSAQFRSLRRAGQLQRSRSGA